MTSAAQLACLHLHLSKLASHGVRNADEKPERFRVKCDECGRSFSVEPYVIKVIKHGHV